MYPENPEGTQLIEGSMNMRYISDTARNRTHNLFRCKREPIPLGHSTNISLFVLQLFPTQQVAGHFIPGTIADAVYLYVMHSYNSI